MTRRGPATTVPTHTTRLCLLVLGLLPVLSSASRTAAWARENVYWRAYPGSTGDWFDRENWVAGHKWGSVTHLRLVSPCHLRRGTVDLSYRTLRIYNSGPEGVFHIGGGGEMIIDTAYVGWNNIGRIVQDGGRLTARRQMYLGWEDNSIGTYALSEGVLEGSSQYVGYKGKGTFIQTGGSHLVGQQLDIGTLGVYRLDGGELHLSGRAYPSYSAGERISGLFRQTSGTHRVDRTLQLMYDGEYRLLGGTLNAAAEQIGESSDMARFLHLAGANDVDHLVIAEHGRYDLASGGSLRIDGGFENRGVFAFVNGGCSVEVSEGSLVNLAVGGTFENPGRATLHVGANSLVILPQGFDPTQEFASYANAGMTHVAGATLHVGPREGFSGLGTIHDHVRCEGTITSRQGRSSALRLKEGLFVSDGGVVDLGLGNLSVKNLASGLADGRIKTRSSRVLQDGRFVQTGGVHNTTESFYCSGLYELRDGTLDVWEDDWRSKAESRISGAGRFVQTGGTHRVREGLTLDGGTYELRDGLLEASVYLGPYEEGSVPPVDASLPRRHDFLQTGGIVDAWKVFVGWRKYIKPGWEMYLLLREDWEDGFPLNEPAPASANHVATYRMAGGELDAYQLDIDGVSDQARFVQDGGVVRASWVELHGVGASYSLYGGSLAARQIEVNEGGAFNQLDSQAEVQLAEALSFGPYATFLAVPDSTIRLKMFDPPYYDEKDVGFYNRSRDSSDLAGLANLTLIFEGEAALARFEVAGRDLGDAPEGFLDNFVLDTLQIGGEEPASVRLVDLFDNQPDWDGPEALYVKNLVVLPGSSLDLNGLSIYYLHGDLDDALAITGGSACAVPGPETLAMLGLGTALLACRRPR